MTRSRIITKILEPYADRPGRYRIVLAMLRVLIRRAIEIEWLKDDPTIGIENAKLNEIRAWTEAEIAQFEARWPIGTRQRTAFALHLYTGQRRSDVNKMQWPDISGGMIKVAQLKTSVKLDIPLHINLREILLAAPRTGFAIINTEDGRPYSIKGFTYFMAGAIKAAGLPADCRPHGLRKAACRRLAEAGCTAKEIAAITGHKTLAEVERYCREADQKKLATAAILKLERPENMNSQTANSSLGKKTKNSGKSME
jgi:integrase